MCNKYTLSIWEGRCEGYYKAEQITKPYIWSNIYMRLTFFYIHKSIIHVIDFFENSLKFKFVYINSCFKRLVESDCGKLKKMKVVHLSSFDKKRFSQSINWMVYKSLKLLRVYLQTRSGFISLSLCAFSKFLLCGI